MSVTTWTLAEHLKKKLDRNYTRMLHAVFNKSWKQQPPKKLQLYSHLPPISQIIQVRWARHAGHNWRSKDKIINNIFLWNYTHGQTSVHQLCSNIGCRLEDLLRVMTARDWQWGKIKRIHALDMLWWYLTSNSHLSGETFAI